MERIHSLAYSLALLLALSLSIGTVSAQDVSGKKVKAKVKEMKDTTRTAIEYSDAYLDTVQLKKVFILNDYTSIGVEYGPSASSMMFNPSKKQSLLYDPVNFGVYMTKYSKMFGYLPYFGLKMGARYSTEGYYFEPDKETGKVSDVDGATRAVIKMVDIPMMAMIHLDATHFSAMANVGIYGGYRLSIEREGAVAESIRKAFNDYDRRFDYGLTGGVGFAIVFDPFDFQVNANVRYSWGTLYDPDYNSKDYYRFAYPLDFSITAGLYYHITRRTGRTKPQMKKEARKMVYGE